MKKIIQITLNGNVLSATIKHLEKVIFYATAKVFMKSFDIIVICVLITQLVLIYENEDIAEDLRKSRQSDFMQRKADAIRFERLLSPILSLQHRTKVWNRLYNT